jgi:hypothetical protein
MGIEAVLTESLLQTHTHLGSALHFETANKKAENRFVAHRKVIHLESGPGQT